jgi:hypothetical protein
MSPGIPGDGASVVTGNDLDRRIMEAFTGVLIILLLVGYLAWSDWLDYRRDTDRRDKDK